MSEERAIPVSNKVLANNLPTLSATNADLEMTATFDTGLFNVGTEQVVLDSPTTNEVELLEERRLKNSVEGIECELLVNQDANIIYQVDVDGSVYLTDKQVNLLNYEINLNAELIYNFT